MNRRDFLKVSGLLAITALIIGKFDNQSANAKPEIETMGSCLPMSLPGELCPRKLYKYYFPFAPVRTK